VLLVSSVAKPSSSYISPLACDNGGLVVVSPFSNLAKLINRSSELPGLRLVCDTSTEHCPQCPVQTCSPAGSSGRSWATSPGPCANERSRWSLGLTSTTSSLLMRITRDVMQKLVGPFNITAARAWLIFCLSLRIYVRYRRQRPTMLKHTFHLLG